jgi:GntR family transcriptional regulator
MGRIVGLLGPVAPPKVAVSKPLYGQVREMLLGRIGRGEWGPGETLPNEFILANQFSVSIGTIRRAIEGLEESGIVVRKQGRGTYVSGQGAQALQTRFTVIRSPSGRPLPLSYRLLGVERRTMSPQEQKQFGAEQPIAVTEIRQLVHSAARPLGVERCVVRDDLFPSLADAMTEGQHLYPLYSELGVLVTRAEHAIRATVADRSAADLLAIGEGAAVLVVTQTAYALDPEPVEVRTSTYSAADVSIATAC